MKDNQGKDPEKDSEKDSGGNKDYKKLSIGLVAGLTIALFAFMIFGISNINLDKDVKKADLLVEEEDYRAAVNIYDRVLRSKNSPEVKKKRDLALELMNPKDKAEMETENKKDDKKDKETAGKDKEDKPAKDKDDKDEEENEEVQEETSETEDDDKENNENLSSEDLDLPSKTVWAVRANIRSGPSENSSVIGVITKDTEVYIEDEQVESSKRTWYKVVTMLNGQKVEGWMASNTLNN